MDEDLIIKFYSSHKSNWITPYMAYDEKLKVKVFHPLKIVQKCSKSETIQATCYL